MKYILSIFTVFTVLIVFAQEKIEKSSLVNLASKQLGEKKFPKNVQFAIGVIDGDDQMTFGFEMKEDWSTLDNENSIFEIGSISKVFTSMLLANAISEGVMNLTDTVQNELAIDWKVEKPITYKMLANHTSGLPRIPSNLMKHALLNKENPYAKYEEEALIKYLEKKMSLKSEPGEKYAYSNLGAGLLGYLVCKKLDLTYEEAIQKYLLEPSSMNNTSTSRDNIEGDMVTGLNKKGKPTSNWDFDVFAGAGAIKSNVVDMLNFIDLQVSDTSETIKLMQTKTHEGEPFHLALGWHIIPSTGWLWHNGGTGGFKSSLAIDTKTNNGVVILTNISSGHENARFVDELVFMLLKEING
jgi:CubicO group peptidase (beta-lactamase class C family)